MLMILFSISFSFYQFINFLKQRNRSIRRKCADSSVPAFLNLSQVRNDIIDTCVANASLTYSVSSESIASIPGSIWSSILTPSGIIYGIPRYATGIVKLDTNTDTVSYINLGANIVYDSAALSPDLKYLYLSPCAASSVGKLNLETDQITSLESLGISGNYKYTFCITAPNNKIYMTSESNHGILEIDSSNDSFNVYTNGTSTCNEYARIFLDMKGNLLCTGGDRTVYKFDINTKTYSLLSSAPVSIGTSVDYNIGADGHYYGLGRGGIQTLVKISAYTGLFQPTIALSSNTYRYEAFSCLAPNGRIYYPQHGSNSTTSIFSVDISGNVVNELSLSCGAFSCILAPNGSIYCLPSNGNQIHKISFTYSSTPRMFNESTLLSPLMNRG